MQRNMPYISWISAEKQTSMLKPGVFIYTDTHTSRASAYIQTHTQNIYTDTHTFLYESKSEAPSNTIL